MTGKTTVENWLSRLAPKTAKDYGYTFDKWLRWMKENGGEFCGMTPDELVEYQKDSDRRSQYDILDHIQRYVSLATKTRVRSKARTYAVMRSFFMHNRAELPRDPHFRIRSDTPPVQGKLTVGELRDIMVSAKPVYRAVLLSMSQGGMGETEFEYWNMNGWKSLREALRREARVVKIDLPGRKKMRNVRNYYTFIAGDALKAIREWIPHRPEGAEAIFTNQYGNPITVNALSLYWKRHLRKMGLVKPMRNGYPGNRYGRNLHEIRDIFRTQWEKSPAKGSVAEFMMGHQVDPLDYNKACLDEDWTRGEYYKALPYLEILTSDRALGKADVDDVEELRRRNDQLEEDNRENEKRMAELSAQVARLAEAVKQLNEEN